MSSNIYLLLGVREGASLAELKKAYARLMRTLEAKEFKGDSYIADRVRTVRARLSASYEHLKDPDVKRALSCVAERRQAQPADHCRPKLGQMLVAAGLISMDELDAVLEIQRNTGHEHIPVGQIMVACGYISEQQLEYYLHQQEMMELPADHPDRWGQRLVDLGLVNEDQLKVALIEQKTTGCTLRQALINRGYLTAMELDRIF